MDLPKLHLDQLAALLIECEENMTRQDITSAEFREWAALKTRVKCEWVIRHVTIRG